MNSSTKEWFKNLVQKRSKMNLHCVMLSRQNSVFDWNQTFKARIWHLQNLMHKKIWRNDSRIWFKSAWKWICSVSCSRDRIHFLTGIKPSELESDISRIFCTRKFDTMIQEFGSKALENEFAVRHALETEFTFWLESNLQNLESDICRIFCARKFAATIQEFGQERSKMNLRCVMLSRQNSVFDWNQTFKARIWHLQNLMHNKICRNDSRI